MIISLYISLSISLIVEGVVLYKSEWFPFLLSESLFVIAAIIAQQLLVKWVPYLVLLLSSYLVVTISNEETYTTTLITSVFE